MTDSPTSQVTCPQCRMVSVEAVGACSHCGLLLDWIARYPEFRQALSATHSEPMSGARPPAIGCTSLQPTPLPSESETTLGRSGESTLSIHHSSINLRHCVFVRQPETGDYWLADHGTSGGTWLDRRRVTSARLTDGALIQTGQFAWVFNAVDGYLVPVGPIAGVGVALCDGVGLTGRIDIASDVGIPAGQFVAITGSSGGGKSTLLKAIAGLPGSRDSGTIRVGGQDIDKSPNWLRSLLGYVSQDDFVHAQLSARQVLFFSAGLRGGTVENDDVEAVLLQVGLPRDRWDATIANLSGGQARRVRTAAELVSTPRLLLLDEPGSGLDLQRELHLMKLLRTLSHRGCTVIMVSHNPEAFSICDRVLRIEKDETTGIGTVVSDARPRPRASVGDSTPVPSPTPTALNQPAAPAESSQKPESASKSTANSDSDPASIIACRHLLWPLLHPGRAVETNLGQFCLLTKREYAMSRRDWKRRWLIPLLMIPGVFALTLGTAIKPNDDDLLGFFSVLSCIWMGGSLSLMQIVGERAVFDHERHLFLRISPYVLAKATALLPMAALQTPVFLMILVFSRRVMNDDHLLRLSWEAFISVCGTAVALVAVAWVGVGQGLLLSALANRSKEVASYVWPLVMIVQIVFSVPVCVGSGKTLRAAYGVFHLHSCKWAPKCGRRATRWLEGSDGHAATWLCRFCSTTAPAGNQSETETAYENRNHPNQVACALSYLTASRYGDIAVRSSLEFQNASTSEKQSLARWWREAIATLSAASAVLLVTTGYVLHVQRRIRKRKSWPEFLTRLRDVRR